DFKGSNFLFQGCCALYYRYICWELNLTSEEIASAANMEYRTVYRRFEIALDRLVQTLIDQETAARKQNLEAVRRARIPFAETHLHERDKLIDSVTGTLRRG